MSLKYWNVARHSHFEERYNVTRSNQEVSEIKYSPEN